MAQWTYWSRKQNLLNFAKSKGKSIGDLNMQLEFLKRTDIQQLIAQNKFDSVYEKLSKKLDMGYISQFTKLLYASDIDPVNYMNKIPSYFLYNSDINEFTIPNSIKSIGDSAFRDCVSLKKITIPDSVTNIEDGAFYNCISLTGFTIPNNLFVPIFSKQNSSEIYARPSLTYLWLYHF